MNKTPLSNEIAFFIEKLSRRVSEIAELPKPSEMKHKDFLLLEEKIYESTGVRLSVSTLKRLWGNIDYNHLPHINTLDTLAIYAKYKNWYHYISKTKKNAVKISPRKFYPVFILLFVLIIIYLYFIKTHIPSYSFQFEVDNSKYPTYTKAIFDIADKDIDKFSLKYSFSKNILPLNPKYKQINKSIFFVGKQRIFLLYQNKVIEQKDFFVPSFTWISFFTTNKTEPLYNTTIPIENGSMCNPPVLHSANLSTHLIFTKDFGLASESLIYKIGFALKFNEPIESMHKATIGLEFENGMIDLGFPNTPFVNKAHVIIGNTSKAGYANDFRNFGIENKQFYKLEITKTNNQIETFIDGKKLIAEKNSMDLGNFYGFNFHSSDTLCIDYIELTNSKGDTLYKNHFNEP